VARAYGVVSALRPWPQRWTFLIGPDGKILAIDKKVRSASHGKDLAALLKELEIPVRRPKS
jgi:peroxiredoxin Q/BCP